MPILNRLPEKFSGRQWCAQCRSPLSDGEGRWVDIAEHCHPLPDLRADVYLYEPAHDGQPEKWAAFLSIWLDELPEGFDSYWLGWREFPTLAEAMDYGRAIAIEAYERRRGKVVAS